MIDEKQLQEWERLANEATDGPWLTYSQAKKVLNVHWNDWFSILAYNGNGKPFILCSSNGAMTTDKAKEEARLKEGLPEPEGQTKCDMAFIAAAREAVPMLIAEVHKLNAITTRLEREATWLANGAMEREVCPPQYDILECEEDKTQEVCAKCWRQAAMDAFEDGSHD